jgi:hypothetical protein
MDPVGIRKDGSGDKKEKVNKGKPGGHLNDAKT